MTRTSPLALVVLVIVGGVVGFALNHTLTATGRATFSPSGFLPVLLLIVAAVTLALAWPVRRSTRGLSAARIDPFRALRAVTLARASSLFGALMTGFGLGLVAFSFTRPVAPVVGSVVAMVALAASGVIVVIAGLVAEQFCTLPKDPDDRQLDDPAPDAHA